MAKKVATPKLQSRMQHAIAAIGRGVNQCKPDLELEGRRQLALARIENEIILGRTFLEDQDVQDLAKMLFDTDDSTDEIPDDARDLAPPLNPTREERIAAMQKGYEYEQTRYPKPDLLDDPDDIE